LINLQGLKYENFYTPLGRFFRKFILHQNIYYNFDIKDLVIFIFNLFVSLILFFVSYRLFLKEYFLKTVFRILLIFLLINLTLLFILYTGGVGLGTIPMYILFFLKPMSIMVLVMLSLFWINQILLVRYSK